MGYRYIGSKARIASEILDIIGNPMPEEGNFIDAFSGTGIVARMAADRGWRVHINDILHCAIILSESRLISSEEIPFNKLNGYSKAIELLNKEEKKGFFYKEYSPASQANIGIQRKYFSIENACKIDGIRAKISDWENNGLITPKEHSILIATLLCAVNEIANIAGTYGCFLSKWTETSSKPLILKPLEVSDSHVYYSSSTIDVFDIQCEPEDVLYLDPPYTKRQYASYYHILETIAIGDEPSVQGVAGLRPWKDKSSVFCYKTKALQALSRLIINSRAKKVFLSYSDEGHVILEELIDSLRAHGTVKIHKIGTIGRYRPNQVASSRRAKVKEFLIEFCRNV